VLIGPACGLVRARRLIHSSSPHVCCDSVTTLAASKHLLFCAVAALFSAARKHLVVAPNRQSRNYALYVIALLLTLLTATALEVLTDWNCSNVSAEAFAKNRASLATADALGLRQPGKRSGKAQKELVRLQMPLRPFERVQPRLKGYESLKGQSWLLHHRAMARVLVEKLGHLPGVQAVLGLGSVARGFADAWSDLDLAVILRGGHGVPWRGERWFAGVSVDLYAVDLDASPSTGWDESRRSRSPSTACRASSMSRSSLISATTSMSQRRACAGASPSAN